MIGKPSLESASYECVANCIPFDACTNEHHGSREDGCEAYAHLVEDDACVNADGLVNGDDLNIMVAIILGNDNAANYDGRADLNADTIVDVMDLNRLINILLGN